MERYGTGGSGDGKSDRLIGGRGRGCRQPEREPLRRPHDAASKLTGNTNQPSDIVKKSVLSVDAAEFIPRNFSDAVDSVTENRERSSMPDLLNIPPRQPLLHEIEPQQGYNLQQMHTHYHHQPRYQMVSPPRNTEPLSRRLEVANPYRQYLGEANIQDFNRFDGGSGDYAAKHQQNSEFENAMLQLDNAMHSLTSNPGDFDYFVDILINIFIPHLELAARSRQVIDTIINQSVIKENLRYNGARLCVHFDATTTANQPTSVFRDTLLAQCQEKVEEQKINWQQTKKHSIANQSQCNGLIMFIAELITKMQSEPVLVLSDLLIQLLSTVLDNPAPSSTKNICQALKLAGHILEKNNRIEMETVMKTLTEIVIEGKADTNTQRMVDNVSELRNENWGVLKRPIPIETKHSSVPQDIWNEPVFYGPDGNVLSAEEKKFLHDNIDTIDNDDQECWPEEEDIIADAYEEFLKMCPNNPSNISINTSSNARVQR